MTLQCRYCGKGGCKRKVIAYLITTTIGTDFTEKIEIPICGKASVELQASFQKNGNINTVGQMLSIRYI